MSLTQDTSSHLLSFGDSPAGDDDDFILLVKRHNFRHTVRGTGMVNVPKQWARVGDARQLSWGGFGSLSAHPECHPQGPLSSSFLIPLSPGRASGQRSINHMFVVYSEHVDASILEGKRLQKWEEHQGAAAVLAVGSGSGLGQWAYLHFLGCFLPPLTSSSSHSFPLLP